MHPHDAPILYGMLLDCKAALQERPDLRKRWSHLGRELLVKVD
ncbi:MAG: conjugal transfer protein [Rickettsiales bacterium]|nr:MAG: conjugal transfer protein [Rickettsiales bacterium]